MNPVPVDTGLPFDRGVRANVCLILEGTYPYVRGGVSTWVEQIIRGMPELSFSIVFLGAQAGDYAKLAYALPSNVVHVELHYLLGHGKAGNTEAAASTENAEVLPDSVQQPSRAPFDMMTGALQKVVALATGSRKGQDARRFAANSALHTRLRDGDIETDHATGAGFTELLSGEQAITRAQLANHGLSWETIREKYGEAPPGLDFNHFFWTVRSMHEPLFTLAEIAANAPPADLYHSVSTGYAGWLGSMLSHRSGTTYIISEHGIYTKERELDLAQVDWIPDDVDPFHVGLDDGMSYLRQVWIRFFRSLGRMSYASATRVFTLYEGNRRRQIADGASADKLSIIPNGVDIARFAAARRSRGAAVPPVLALIGRVVPIKDTKTFIRAMRTIRASIPEAQGWLVGPVDEDPAYTEECRQLVASLGLEDCVQFLGFGMPEAIFPRIGLNVLTSVSEGQPLTVLEGFAAGVPALTTDVGSCHELIKGNERADRELGSAGAVVPLRNPTAFAAAAVALLGDLAAWQRASVAAIARVETYYDQRDMIARYREVYQTEMSLDTSEQSDDAWREAS